MPHKPKHRRNRSIYASSKQDSFEKEHEELNQLVIQTIKKSQAQPTQSKIQYVDDFTEDINTLAEKVENEHKKESQSKYFSFFLLKFIIYRKTIFYISRHKKQTFRKLS